MMSCTCTDPKPRSAEASPWPAFSASDDEWARFILRCPGTEEVRVQTTAQIIRYLSDPKSPRRVERVWEDLCGELRTRESRMSGILCDLGDVPSDPVEGLRVLAEGHKRRGVAMWCACGAHLCCPDLKWPWHAAFAADHAAASLPPPCRDPSPTTKGASVAVKAAMFDVIKAQADKVAEWGPAFTKPNAEGFSYPVEARKACEACSLEGRLGMHRMAIVESRHTCAAGPTPVACRSCGKAKALNGFRRCNGCQALEDDYRREARLPPEAGPTPGGAVDFTATAKDLAIATLEHIDYFQACPFCKAGEDDGEGADKDHEEECPLVGFAQTRDCEALRAWAKATPSSREELLASAIAATEALYVAAGGNATYEGGAVRSALETLRALPKGSEAKR